MAKVKLPLMSMVVEGKVGDIVFYRLGKWNMNCARMRVIPANPKTPNQEAVRNNLRLFTQGWRTGEFAGKTVYIRQGENFVARTIASNETFTDEDRNAWKNYYITTKAGRIYGRLAFVALNLKRTSEGLAPWKRPGIAFNLQTS